MDPILDRKLFFSRISSLIHLHKNKIVDLIFLQGRTNIFIPPKVLHALLGYSFKQGFSIYLKHSLLRCLQIQHKLLPIQFILVFRL